MQLDFEALNRMMKREKDRTEVSLNEGTSELFLTHSANKQEKRGMGQSDTSLWDGNGRISHACQVL